MVKKITATPVAKKKKQQQQQNTSVRVIRPLAVVAHKNVGFFQHDTTDQDWQELDKKWLKRIAFAFRKRDYAGDYIDAYEIHVILPNLKAIFASTPYALNDGLFQAFLNGVTIHEVAHVLFDTLLFAKEGMNKIYKHIWNVLMDVHDEYWMSYYHPVYAPYIQFALSLMQHTSPAEEGTKLQEDLQTFFFLARFGILPPTYDKDFVHFLLPFIRSSFVVRDQANTVACADAVYDYLEAKYTSGSKAMKKQWDDAATKDTDEDGQEGLSQGDADKLAQGTQKLDNAMGAMLQALSDATDSGDSDQKAKALEKMAGLQGAPILFNEADAAFVRKVIAEHPEIIERLRAGFMQLWDAPDMVSATDGDMNLQMQQELYVSSFTREEVPAYFIPMNVMPSISLVVARDISESTEDMINEYATACILYLAALSDIEGVDIAEIDFNDEAAVKLWFGQNVESLALAPVFDGGTSLDAVIPLLKLMEYRQAVRICIFITDGYIGNWNWAKKELEDLEKSHGLITFIVEVVPDGQTGKLGYVADWPNGFSSSISDLPTKLNSHVIAKIRALRGGYVDAWN